MGSMERYKRSDDVDVILQHNADGEIIPLRIRITDEDGEKQAYTITGCKAIDDVNACVMPDGVAVCQDTMIFDCHIPILGQDRMIRLYFSKFSFKWTMTWQTGT